MAEENDRTPAEKETPAIAVPTPKQEESPTELLIRLQKKQLRQMRIQTALLSVMLAFTLVVGLSLLVGVNTAVAQLQSVDLGKINDAVADACQIVEQVSRLDLKKIDGAIEALTDAASNLSAVDMESINQAVASLDGAAENLGKLDMEKMNKTVSALQSVVENLSAVAEKLRNPFGR